MDKPRITESRHQYALCVGINQYAPAAQLGDLSYAENDARAIYELLLQSGFVEKNCRLLLGAEATTQAVYTALKTLLVNKPAENDLVIFYFSGHALSMTPREKEGNRTLESEVFLVTYNFDRERMSKDHVEQLAYPLSWRQLSSKVLERSPTQQKVFFLDACYSGDVYSGQYRVDERRVSRAIAQAFTMQRSGRVVISSRPPKQGTGEDETLRNDQFTWHLLKALRGEVPEAIRRDGWLTLDSLYEYLSQHISEDQRPMKGGIEQSTFKLLYYPQLEEHTREDREQTQTTYARRTRLKAMLADHRGFMRDRLESFVGRQTELAELRQHIAEKLQTGGYVTITGQAGQGKSSVIAMLVEEYGVDNAAFHFIPFNPGPDHQVGLLRNLMARLILKYDLSDIYIASESRSALRDYFPKVLRELVTKGGQEAIFIDGLDQLEEEASGVRDLSFLPNNPPTGVVFVLGTRPNDTLRPLELLKPRHEYQLPNLNRQDFDLILQHRGVSLGNELADRFYTAMQENALYLDLSARELAETGATHPFEVFKRVSDNPDNIFSLSIERFKRQNVQWRTILKPLLGLLLAAREPILVSHIRQMLAVGGDEVREGLSRLGGLVAEDGQGRWYLFHIKLRDYLHQDEHSPDKDYVFALDEEASWHNTLAAWCEQDDVLRIWEEVKNDSIELGRRIYARQHYLAHLYYAKQWSRLFATLDAGIYGHAKMQYDPSTRSYTQDLELGRRAAAWKGWSFENGIAMLPQLWRYTLLQCSLTSRADNYSFAAFEALVLIKREKEALGLAELLSKPDHKAHVLLKIAELLGRERGGEHESLQVLLRVREVAKAIEEPWNRAEVLSELGHELAKAQQWERAEAIWAEVEIIAHSIEDSNYRAEVLSELGRVLMKAQQWERAMTVVHSIEDDYKRTEVLSELSRALAQAQQWESALALTHTIEDPRSRAEVLSELGHELAKAQQWERAEAIWAEVEIIAHSIEDSNYRAEVLSELGRVLMKAQQWERAEAILAEVEIIAYSIQDSNYRAEVLSELGRVLMKAQQWERAEAILAEVEIIAYSIQDSWSRAKVLSRLGLELAKAQQWERAMTVARSIENSHTRAKALSELGRALTQAQQWERAEALWTEVETIASSIENSDYRSKVLGELGRALTKAQQWERAEAVARTIETPWHQAEVLSELGHALIQAQQWERAMTVVHSIEDNYKRAEVLSELGRELAKAQQWERAEALWTEVETAIHFIDSIEDGYVRAKALSELGRALTQAQQWERAEALWTEVETIASSIENSDYRSKVLGELGRALTKAQQWERAEAVARTIETPWHQAEVLSELGHALIQAQQWERAMTVVHSIEDNYKRAEVLSELGRELAKAQQWERAEALWTEVGVLAHSIEDSGRQAKVMSELGRALTQAQQWERAEALWTEVETIASSIETSWSRAEVLGELGRELAKAQQWEHVMTVAHSIEDNYKRAEVLSELGRELAKAQQWERAAAVTHTIEDYHMRINALSELGRELAKAQQWERAEAVVRSIKDSNYRAGALIELGRELAKAQGWKRAEALWTEVEVIANSIEALWSRAKVLSELGRELANAQQWEQAITVWSKAETVIHSIEDIHMRDKVLSELGRELANAQQWEQAEAVTDSIQDSRSRVEILQEISRNLDSIGKREQTLHLVQHAWLQADTKAYAINLLPLATGLIHLKPEIGSALYEAFAWVETFLED